MTDMETAITKMVTRYHTVCTKTAQPLTFLPPVVVTVPCPYPAPYKGYNDGGPPPIVTYVDYNLPSVTSTVVLDPVTTTGTM
ncbi:hypothetical protein BB558_003787 [Smittium angustum]|uniref:Uncharacterized protein n=1 Tax=Smittium angustum TaxID=133377 RepID=A0A2U1J515_SMIAN|nr:hypothetical protein BB558_003787 [Smittium angustum]